MQKLTAEERETHILICETSEHLIIDTSVRTVITKCYKQGYEVVREERYPDGTLCSVVFKAPKNAITFRSMAALQKPLSNKQLEQRKNFTKAGQSTRF